MTPIVLLEIVGMAIVGALGGVAIFEILHRIEKHRITPSSASVHGDSATDKGKIAMPT